MSTRPLAEFPSAVRRILNYEFPLAGRNLYQRVFFAAIYDAPEMVSHYLEQPETAEGKATARKEVETVVVDPAYYDGVSLTPPEVAAMCGSLQFLKWWHAHFGRMDVASMLDISCSEGVPESLKWLIENRFTLKPMSDNDDAISTCLTDRSTILECVDLILSFDLNKSGAQVQLSEKCLCLLAPFARAFEDYPTMEDHGDDGGPLITNPNLSDAVYKTLRDEFGHGPTKSNWAAFLDSMFNDTNSGKRQFAYHFTRMINDFFPEPDDRVPIVSHYVNGILRCFKYPPLLSFILNHEIIPCDSNLVASIHAIDPTVHSSFDSALCQDIFDCLTLVLPTVAAKTCGSGASSWDLAAAMSNTVFPETDSKALEGFRGLVRLLLFFGAKPDHPQVHMAVNTYKNLREDILDVARWKRWEESGNFCGLPGELTRMIMFKVWRGTFVRKDGQPV